MIDADCTTASAKRTLLITGAGGFLGTKLVEQALAKGYRVVAVVNQYAGSENNASIALQNLQKNQRRDLKIFPADLTKSDAVARIFTENPEIDDVIHAAAVKNFTVDAPSVERANAINVHATHYLANAAQAHAQATNKTVGFHMISSTTALMHERNAVPDHHEFARKAYAQQKTDSVGYLKAFAAAPHNRLDIRVTYPMLIVGTEPDATFVGNLLKHAHSKQADASPSDIDAWLRERVNQQNLGQPNEMVRRANYAHDILACFSAKPVPGFHEYSVEPDYVISLGSMLRIARQVVAEKRGQIPDETLGEQMWLPVTVRELPTPQQALSAPAHERFDLRALFAAKYDAIGAALDKSNAPNMTPAGVAQNNRTAR